MFTIRNLFSSSNSKVIYKRFNNLSQLNLKNFSNFVKPETNTVLNEKNISNATENEKNNSNSDQSASMVYKLEFLQTNLSKASMQIEKEKTLLDLEGHIKKGNKFMTIQFKTWDDSLISKNNKIESLCTFGNIEPVFMRINNMEWQLLNFSSNDGEEQSGKYFNKNELSKLDIAENIHNEEFDGLLTKVKNKNKNNNLKEQDKLLIASKLFKIKHFDRIFEQNEFLKNFKNLEDVLETFYQTKSEYIKLHQAKEKIFRNSEIRAKILIFLAGILFILELFAVYYATFVLYSWDITEPAVYLLGCANFVLILLLKKRMGNMTPLSYYSNNFFGKLSKKYKFNVGRFNSTSKKLKELELILNK